MSPPHTAMTPKQPSLEIVAFLGCKKSLGGFGFQFWLGKPSYKQKVFIKTSEDLQSQVNPWILPVFEWQIRVLTFSK